MPDKESALLAIPEICTDKVITFYYSSLFVGHQGVIKCISLLGTSFMPGLMHCLCPFIKGCHVCQLTRKDKPPVRQLQTRIYLNYRPLLQLSMDLKVMPKSYKGHKFILCIIDEGTNYLITVPIYQSRLEEIGDALIENVVFKYCVPNYLIMDLDSAFMSTLMNCLFRKFDIKMKTVAPYNHHPLQEEHGIKSWSNILTKYLTNHGQIRIRAIILLY